MDLRQVSPGAAIAAPDSQLIRLHRYFDLQGHRGGRGEHIENTLDSFAWGIIDGTAELT